MFTYLHIITSTSLVRLQDDVNRWLQNDLPLIPIPKMAVETFFLGWYADDIKIQDVLAGSSVIGHKVMAVITCQSTHAE
jgi:hypothetical protein